MSERQLSKSYGTLRKWKKPNGKIQQWIRWEFSRPKEKWLDKNQLTEQWLFEHLEWMLESKIVSIRKADESRLYYIVTTQKGEEYNLIFEQVNAVNELVLIFEDHFQSYSYNTVLHTLDFNFFEAYDCFQNGIEDIAFGHNQEKDYVYVVTTIVGGRINLEFSSKHNLPVCKLFSEYKSLFEEISKYNFINIGPYEKKSYMETVVKIANMLKKRISEEIISYKVVFDYNQEWFDVDSDGVSMKVRLCNGEHFVICNKDGSTEWINGYSTSYRGYRIKDGAIVNCENEKLTDKKLAKTIISDIREAKSIFYRAKQEFLAD